MVNPTTPIGERDIKPTPSGQIVVDFLRRKFPAYVDTGLNLVDVIDCADGHLLAMEKAQPGRALHPRRRESDAEADPRQAGARSPDCRRRRSSCLTRVALATGVVDTLVTGKMLQARAAGDASMRCAWARKKMFVTSAKAERELGWNPRPVDDALRRAVEWFQANGYAA